jgi:hypothetical protein
MMQGFFRDLATTPVYKIEEVLEAAGPQFARHDPSTWTQQAKLAAEGRWDDLAALKGFLIRGKEPEQVAETTPEVEVPIEFITHKVEEEATEIEIPTLIAIENQPAFVEEVATPIAAVAEAPVVENNLDSITEDMLEKVNKVKAAIRKAMVEKNDAPTKDTSPLPTLNDVIGKPNENSGGSSFFDNI